MFFCGIAFFFLIVLGTGLFAPWGEILQLETKKQMSRVGQFFFSIMPILLTLLATLLIGGMLGVAFSKERIEDEFLLKLRKNAFLNAVLYNYILLMLLYFWLPNPGFLTFFGHSIFNVLLMYIFDFHARLNYPDYWEKLGEETKNLFKNAK